MELTPTADANQKQRKLANLCTLGIPDLYQLGKVELLSCSAVMEEHLHPDMFEICYHFEGSQYYEIEGRGYETRGGDLFLTLPNELHGTGNRREEKSRLYYFIFRCMPDTEHFMGLDAAVSDYIRDTLFSVRSRLFRGNEAIKAALEQILLMYFSDSPFRTARIRSLATEFFYQLTRQIERSGQERLLPEDIRETIGFIEGHPRENFTVNELAGRVYLSLPQFKKKFKQATGFTPYAYIVRYKTQLAREMLRHTFMTTTEIAYELGFSSSQHFSTVFRRFCGLTPTEYRKSCRGGK